MIYQLVFTMLLFSIIRNMVDNSSDTFGAILVFALCYLVVWLFRRMLWPPQKAQPTRRTPPSSEEDDSADR